MQFDSVTLPTAFGPEGQVTVFIPREFLSVPGRHEIRLTSALGNSEPLAFVIASPVCPGADRRPGVERRGA